MRRPKLETPNVQNVKISRKYERLIDLAVYLKP